MPARCTPPSAEGGPDQTYWRFANFMLPFWTQTPQGKFAIHLHNRAWVPMDDEHTMFISLRWRREAPFVTDDRDGNLMPGFGRNFDYLPNTTDWLGRWRLKANASNDWGMNRAAQLDNTIYSGIESIHLQDQAVTESMGAILDHSIEHLAPSDLMITRTRRRLLVAARALRDNGVPPPGADDVEVFRDARGGYFVSDNANRWQDVYAAQLAVAARPQPTALHALE
jgi:phthalate 4,5-dioxygenase